MTLTHVPHRGDAGRSTTADPAAARAAAYPAYRPTPEEAARFHVGRWDRPPSRIAPPCRALVYDILARADDAGGAAATRADGRLRARARALLDDDRATEYDFRAWLVALRRHVQGIGRDAAFATGSPADTLWARVLALTNTPRPFTRKPEIAPCSRPR